MSKEICPNLFLIVQSGTIDIVPPIFDRELANDPYNMKVGDFLDQT